MVWWQISCSFHIWKPFLAASFRFPAVIFYIQATFWLKKHAIQHDEKNFFVSDSFETYGGLIPLTSPISIPSFVLTRSPAAEKCCLKVFKIQQRGDPREIFRSVQNLNCFQNHLILWQISCSFHIWKPFLAAVFSFPTMHFFIQATFGWKKHAIQQGQKNFFVSDSFLTYGGFTHPTSRISM